MIPDPILAHPTLWLFMIALGPLPALCVLLWILGHPWLAVAAFVGSLLDAVIHAAMRD